MARTHGWKKLFGILRVINLRNCSPTGGKIAIGNYGSIDMRVYILLLNFLFLSCSQTLHVSSDVVYTIDLDKVQMKEKESFSSLFKAAGVIVLEMTDNSLLAKIDKIDFIDDSLYVLERGKGLFLFNGKGKFIRKIGDKGAGVGEYISPIDVSVDTENKKLYLLDSQTQTILKYNADGDYESSFKIDNQGMFCNRIQYYNGKLYTNLYISGEGESKFLLSEVDIKNGKRTSFWLDPVQYNKGWNNMFIANQQPFISSYAGKPRFYQLFMDTIFEITQESIQPYIVFQSNNFVTRDYLNIQKETRKASKIFSDLNSTGKIYNICNYVESGRYIYFNYYMRDNLYICFYDKLQKSMFVTQNVKNDLLYVDDDEVQLFPNFISFDEERAYSIEMNNDFSRNMFLKDIQNDRINRNMKCVESFQNISEDSNPVIIYYEFKK